MALYTVGINFLVRDLPTHNLMYSLLGVTGNKQQPGPKLLPPRSSVEKKRITLKITVLYWACYLGLS